MVGVRCLACSVSVSPHNKTRGTRSYWRHIARNRRSNFRRFARQAPGLDCILSYWRYSALCGRHLTRRSTGRSYLAPVSYALCRCRARSRTSIGRGLHETRRFLFACWGVWPSCARVLSAAGEAGAGRRRWTRPFGRLARCGSDNARGRAAGPGRRACAVPKVKGNLALCVFVA